jgi:glyoxylate carboligase
VRAELVAQDLRPLEMEEPVEPVETLYSGVMFLLQEAAAAVLHLRRARHFKAAVAAALKWELRLALSVRTAEPQRRFRAVVLRLQLQEITMELEGLLQLRADRIMLSKEVGLVGERLQAVQQAMQEGLFTAAVEAAGVETRTSAGSLLAPEHLVAASALGARTQLT